MTKEITLAQALIDESDRRMFGECWPRIKQCLAELTEDDIWFRPNEASNSVGNIVLHLCGNVGQYVLFALGGRPDRRKRAEEFSSRGPIPKAELIAKLDATLTEAREIIRGFDHAKLTEFRRVQGSDERAVAVIIHVVEHFSYHTGQIAYFVKAGKGIDLGFYRGVDLSKTGAQ
jgi:uncharacterized damage-inducible protein DinB